MVSPVAAALARAVVTPMGPEAITLLTLTGGAVQFVWNRVPVDFGALGPALFLYGAGVLSLPEALAGYLQGQGPRHG